MNSSIIIFENNTFDSNIGLHGGAVHIDTSPLQGNVNTESHFQPYIYFKKNEFTRNMAYFEGNSVYITGGKKHKEITLKKYEK